MIEYETVGHHIQKHILGYLIVNRRARFSEMRPAGTDTNLYSYHLKKLTGKSFVKKFDDGYGLDMKGILYTDRVNFATVTFRYQPKIITMLLVKDPAGRVLIYRKRRHPFIGSWTLPIGKVHIDDPSVQAAAEREVGEKLHGMGVTRLTHKGDVYVHINADDTTTMSTLVHVFTAVTDQPLDEPYWAWCDRDELAGFELTPGILAIYDMVKENDRHFFGEITTDWT